MFMAEIDFFTVCILINEMNAKRIFYVFDIYKQSTAWAINDKRITFFKKNYE